MHVYVHFVYNSKNADERPRNTDFGVEHMSDYPMPFTRKDGAARLTAVLRRLLDYADPHAAFNIHSLLIAWHPVDEVNEVSSGSLLEEILRRGMGDPLLAARIYVHDASAMARRSTFEITNILIGEAENCIQFLGESEYAGEVRLVKAKMAFVAISGLNALSGTMASVVMEEEHVNMIRDFMLAQQYSLASRAVSQYMDCVDYIPRPTRVNDVLDLLDMIGAKCGNNAYMWTTRLLALGSTPLKAHIALGRQSVWCKTYLETYADTGALEVVRRYALYYSMYYHRIGDWTQQLHWFVMAGDINTRITNDPETHISNVYATFTVMLLRLQNLPTEEMEDEMEGVQEYGVEGFYAAQEAGYNDLAHKFLTKLSILGVPAEALLGASQEELSLAVAPLGEPQNLDAEELLDLYIKQRDLLDRLLDHNLADKAFELYDQMEAYMEPIFKLLRHGTDLKLRMVDFATVQNAISLKLSGRVMGVESATFEQRMRAFEIAKATAAQSEELGELHSQRQALFVAAQWAFRLKQPNWGKDVLDLLYEAEDCMDITRAHVTGVSRIDSLGDKQRLVASFGRSDVYTFGYMVMAALNDSTDLLSITSPKDKITSKDIWAWTQRGKGRSVIDLLHAAESEAESEAEQATSEPAAGSAMMEAKQEATTQEKANLATEIGASISLADVQVMSGDYAKNETGSAMILVDWFVASGHIDMIIVDGDGNIHNEILDFTLEYAMKSLMRQPCSLRAAADVKAWKETYLGQTEFLSDMLTTEALTELNWLVEPLQKHSKPGDLLVFCPSGVLHGLPLHALSIDGQCLIERNPIVYTGSLSLLLNCYRRANTRAATVYSTSAVFGVYGKSGQSNGSKSTEEAKVEETLERVSSSLHTKAVYGISPDAFVEKCRDQHVIHYHGHAVLGRAKQGSFGQSLLLADSSTDSNFLQWDDAIEDSLLLGTSDALSASSGRAVRLTARDMIARLKLSSAHVTLIACNSASQEFSAGDEPQGMIPVLLLCGATSVLGTLWPILSSDGRSFSESFYTSFGETGSVVNLARAMQQSVLTIKAARPKPIHWAGFVLHGAWFHKC